MNLGDIPLVVGLVGFALLLVLLAEWNSRREAKRKCMCGHPRSSHDTYMLNCHYTEMIGGLKFTCYCPEFRGFSSKVSR